MQKTIDCADNGHWSRSRVSAIEVYSKFEKRRERITIDERTGRKHVSLSHMPWHEAKEISSAIQQDQ